MFDTSTLRGISSTAAGLRRALRLCCLISIAAAPIAIPSEPAASQREFAFKTIGVATLPWDSTWKAAEVQEDGLSATIEFGASDLHQMRVTLTTAPALPPWLLEEAGRRAFMEAKAREVAKLAVEKTLELHSFYGSEASGIYMCGTDPAPKPGKYPFTCMGVLAVGGRPFQLMIFHNEEGRAAAAKALESIAGMRLRK